MVCVWSDLEQHNWTTDAINRPIQGTLPVEYARVPDFCEIRKTLVHGDCFCATFGLQ
jgi:hypothetical protein